MTSTTKLICILLLLCTTLNTRAQSDSVFQFVKTINGSYTYFNVDNLDNVYLLINNNQLKKIKANGDSVAVFNEVKKYGKPDFIDVTNPLKALLYYKNYSTIVTLDRFLATRNTLNLRNKQIFYVNTVSLAYDNFIWIFDEEDFKLKKIDDDGKLLQAGTDWRLLFDTVPSPVKIIDRDYFVYLYDPAKGFYIFDYYGGLKNRLPFLQWTNVEVIGNTLYGFTQNRLYSYELKSLQLKEYKLPEFFGKFSSIKIMNGKVYLLNEKGIDVYQIK